MPSQLYFPQLSDFCDCGFERVADVRQVRLQGSRGIWIPFILLPRIEGKSTITLRRWGLRLLRFLCRWEQTDWIWWAWNREATQGIERQRNVKSRSTHGRLLNMTVAFRQRWEWYCVVLWHTTIHGLKHTSTVTHPAIPMTHKHWGSECDRQEQREDAAVTSVSLFRQQRVCNGCSPVTNSEACLYPHSFIHHPQHVANNHKNASCLPRHRFLLSDTWAGHDDNSTRFQLGATYSSVWVSHRGSICHGHIQLSTANTWTVHQVLVWLTLE